MFTASNRIANAVTAALCALLFSTVCITGAVAAAQPIAIAAPILA